MQGYVFLSLLAAFFYSLAGISGKFATKHKIENIFKLLFWLNVSALLSRAYPRLLEHHSGKVYAIRALGSAIMIGAVILIFVAT